MMSNDHRGIGFDYYENKQGPVTTGKKYLLVIGNNDYDSRSGFGPLKYPIDDGKKLAKLLVKEYGFEDKVIFSFNNTRDQILKSIRDLVKILKSEDQLVVFYAGHGAIDNDEGFWIGIDANSDVVLNVPVTTVLGQLKGRCRQVLLITDCCYSGSITEAAFRIAAFSKLINEKSTFTVITSGNKYQQVLDKSPFIEKLLHILSTRNISNLEELIGDIKVQMGEKSESTITYFSSIDQLGLPFLLQRADKAAFELANSFFNLNYSKQTPYIKGLAVVNLIYLPGTKEGAHHFFAHRYFRENQVDTEKMFNLNPKVIRFGGDSQSEDYSIFQQLAKEFGLTKADPGNIINKIFCELTSTDWILIIKVDENCDNEALQTALFDFWNQVDNYLVHAKNINEENRIYFFIWDRRESQEKIDDKWTQKSDYQLARILHLDPIENLGIKKDLVPWYSSTKSSSKHLKLEKSFSNINLNNISTPHTIENVICQIAYLCERKKVYENLFIKKNLWIQ